jgi:hypothetical protein
MRCAGRFSCPAAAKIPGFALALIGRRLGVSMVVIMVMVVMMPMVVMMAMVVMIMAVPMIVPVTLRMSMVVIVIMIMMMQALPWPGTARIFAEHQRFDRHRHRKRGHSNATEIDIVEIPQHYAVDDQELAFDAELVAQDVAERLRHVAVEHDEDRFFPGDAVSKSALDALSEGQQAFVGGHAVPAQGHGDFPIAVL